MSWRPNNWKNRYEGVRGFNAADTVHLIGHKHTFEAGADAMLEALKELRSGYLLKCIVFGGERVGEEDND